MSSVTKIGFAIIYRFQSHIVIKSFTKKILYFQIKKTLIPSDEIIKSRIKIKARNFENKNKKQKRSMKENVSTLPYSVFIKVMLRRVKLCSFINKKKIVKNFF